MASEMKVNPERGAGPSKAENQSKHMADAKYSFDPEKLSKFRESKPWMKDPKHFQKVALSPSAIMKMMMHCQSGVDKGIQKGGNPTEVMGLLLGRPDPENPKTLVVTDAFPLPIEGFETRVIADDQDVVNHMISLGECLEGTRLERYFGWYHSHPFDLGEHSHCFLSQTDLSTQLQWQRAEDPHGNPFVAIVIDPLRSAHTGSPEIKAFRAYPPEYNSSVPNECPDGSVEPSDHARLELWGSCWNRYYELKVEYFMSSSARTVMEQLTQDYMWTRVLGGAGTGNSVNVNDADYQKKLPDRICKCANRFKGLNTGSTQMPLFGTRPARAGTEAIMSSPVASTVVGREESNDTENAVQEVVQLASEQLLNATLQQTKQQVFSTKK